MLIEDYQETQSKAYASKSTCINFAQLMQHTQLTGCERFLYLSFSCFNRASIPKKASKQPLLPWHTSRPYHGERSEGALTSPISVAAESI